MSGAIMPRRAGRSRFRPEAADEQGLVAIGGDLAPATLLDAYRSGVFPWYDENTPICWWSPDPRAIIPLDGLRMSTSLRKSCRRYEIRFDSAFTRVITRSGGPVTVAASISSVSGEGPRR